MSEYDVDGIPHFVFLDAQGRKQGQVVGRLPKEVLRSNADALVAGAALPYAKAAGSFPLPRGGFAWLSPVATAADATIARLCRGHVGRCEPGRARAGVGAGIVRPARA